MDNPFMPLTLIAGPAILTNASAIMQNSATVRYSLAIAQWREFQRAMAAGEHLFGHVQEDEEILLLAARRLRMLLWGLDLLYAATGLFGVSALLGLLGAVLAASPEGPDVPMAVVLSAGGAGVIALLAALVVFIRESGCTRALMALQMRGPTTKKVIQP